MARTRMTAEAEAEAEAQYAAAVKAAQAHHKKEVLELAKQLCETGLSMGEAMEQARAALGPARLPDKKTAVKSAPPADRKRGINIQSMINAKARKRAARTRQKAPAPAKESRPRSHGKYYTAAGVRLHSIPKWIYDLPADKVDPSCFKPVPGDPDLVLCNGCTCIKAYRFPERACTYGRKILSVLNLPHQGIPRALTDGTEVYLPLYETWAWLRVNSSAPVRATLQELSSLLKVSQSKIILWSRKKDFPDFVKAGRSGLTVAFKPFLIWGVKILDPYRYKEQLNIVTCMLTLYLRYEGLLGRSNERAA